MMDYKGMMRYYKVTIPEDIASPPYKNIGTHDFHSQRRAIEQFKNTYRKWAWDACGGTWAISAVQSVYDKGNMKYWFYIGFAEGEDKLSFRLSHDPEEVFMYPGHIPVFARENH